MKASPGMETAELCTLEFNGYPHEPNYIYDESLMTKTPALLILLTLLANIETLLESKPYIGEHYW